LERIPYFIWGMYTYLYIYKHIYIYIYRTGSTLEDLQNMKSMHSYVCMMNRGLCACVWDIMLRVAFSLTWWPRVHTFSFSKTVKFLAALKRSRVRPPPPPNWLAWDSIVVVVVEYNLLFQRKIVQAWNRRYVVKMRGFLNCLNGVLYRLYRTGESWECLFWSAGKVYSLNVQDRN
jgi:hypothetical protein